MKELPFAGGKDVCSVLSSPDNRLLIACGEHTYYRCYEIASGKLLWSYPNPFFQVHGSHHAPAPEPGLTRGAYGFVGAFTHPNTGTVWAINANLGEWYFLTEKGYFLARIFEGDAMQWQWPAKAEVGAGHDPLPARQRRGRFRRFAHPGQGRQGLRSGRQERPVEPGIGQPGSDSRDRPPVP